MTVPLDKHPLGDQLLASALEVYSYTECSLEMLRRLTESLVRFAETVNSISILPTRPYSLDDIMDLLGEHYPSYDLRDTELRDLMRKLLAVYYMEEL